ncbi:unnamed protein product [Candidula unifasciata]|uniref:G-protein coupled receptors family 1 profile domain-containing protein n=1 Tax=Candidula unifasciata TaxID=100452 RepID=A0A8S3YXH4_9EUPU|nr:unnamed protein product [Candidula unifasciata]
MGVVRDRETENRPLRGMLPSSQEAGKGLYIGGEDSPPTYHQRHHHHHTSTVNNPTDTYTSRYWPVQQSETDRAYHSGKGVSSDFHTGEKQPPFLGTMEYTNGQHLPLVGPSPTPPSSAPASTIFSFYSKKHASDGDLPYKQNTFSLNGHSHQRLNMTPHNSAYTSIQRNAHNEIYPSSASPQLLPNSNFLNLGTDQARTANPLADQFYIKSLDPLSPTLEVPWNISDTLCNNRTTGSYDCWELFNPDENETSTQNPFIDDDYRFWTLVLIIIPILTVFGNILVVLSVIKEKSLKTVTNYFICSLAVADIMVAVIVMPFAVYMESTTFPLSFYQVPTVS